MEQSTEILDKQFMIFHGLAWLFWTFSIIGLIINKWCDKNKLGFAHKFFDAFYTGAFCLGTGLIIGTGTMIILNK